MNNFITNARPATLPEKGHSRAAQENRNWYLVDRCGLIGITATPQATDEVMSTYEPERINRAA